MNEIKRERILDREPDAVVAGMPNFADAGELTLHLRKQHLDVVAVPDFRETRRHAARDGDAHPMDAGVEDVRRGG